MTNCSPRRMELDGDGELFLFHVLSCLQAELCGGALLQGVVDATVSPV